MQFDAIMRVYCDAGTLRWVLERIVWTEAGYDSKAGAGRLGRGRESFRNRQRGVEIVSG